MVPFAAVVLLAPWATPSPPAVRDAAERALPPLARAAAGHAEQKTCFACHNQALPLVAFAAARGRGAAVDEGLVRDQAEHVHDFLSLNKDAFRSGRGTGGQVDTAGWALLTLEVAGREPDDVTAAVAGYLLRKDAGRGHWPAGSARPPSEASPFATTYLAVRGLRTWAPADLQGPAAERIRVARAWAERTPARDTEDRVFRLRLLKAAGAGPGAVRAAAAELWAGQRADGGWGQAAALPGDAYATGSALAALGDGDPGAVGTPAFRRGVGFLLRTQRPDGTWHVGTRSRPFQPYYESGFPYGKDQFISAAASGWAAAAVWLAAPPGGPPGRPQE